MPPGQQISFLSVLSTMMMVVVLVVTLPCTLSHGLVSGELDVAIEDKPDRNQSTPEEILLSATANNGNLSSVQPSRRALVKRQANHTSGNGMVTHDSNTTPNGDLGPNHTPNPKTIADCDKEWKEWFSGRKAKDDHERNCCYREKMCDCISEMCQKHPDTEGCPRPCVSTPDCINNTLPLDQCMALPVLDGKDSVGFNWLWILLLVAVLMIIIIAVAICCVYRKKFCGQDSSSDAKHGKLKFGQMNVASKVKWKGKSSKNSNKSSKKGSSKGSRKKTSVKQSASKNSNKKSKKGFTHKGKQPGTSMHSRGGKSKRVTHSAVVKAVS